MDDCSSERRLVGRSDSRTDEPLEKTELHSVGAAAACTRNRREGISRPTAWKGLLRSHSLSCLPRLGLLKRPLSFVTFSEQTGRQIDRRFHKSRLPEDPPAGARAYVLGYRLPPRQSQEAKMNTDERKNPLRKPCHLLLWNSLSSPLTR